MNQIENWFGIITKQAIRRGTFASVAALTRRIRDYIEHWNTDARPFVWTATADEVLAKVRRNHRQATRLEDIEIFLHPGRTRWRRRLWRALRPWTWVCVHDGGRPRAAPGGFTTTGKGGSKRRKNAAARRPLLPQISRVATPALWPHDLSRLTPSTHHSGRLMGPRRAPPVGKRRRAVAAGGTTSARRSSHIRVASLPWWRGISVLG
jgi:hypothetical protein